MIIPEVNGKPCARVELEVNTIGPWLARVTMPDDVRLDGAAAIVLGSTTLYGTIDPSQSGTFAGQAHYTIVAGKHGWAKFVTTKDYHNDAGVKREQVARDLADLVGETIGSFTAGSLRFNPDYARRSSVKASTLFEDCADGVPWYVDYDGKTYVKARDSYEPAASAYHVESWDPVSQVVELVADDVATIRVGATLKDERFSGPLTVRALTLICESGRVVIRARVGDTLPDVLRDVVRQVIDPRLCVAWRYIVDRQSDDGRLDLRAVSPRAPFPSLRSVPYHPGVAGAYSSIKNGAAVLVEFLEYDASLPRVTGLAEARDPSYVGDQVSFGTNKPADALPVVRVSDRVVGGGIGQLISFSSPAGVPLFLHDGTKAIPGPYLVSFGAIPPTAASAVPLYSSPVTGSKKVGAAT